MPIQTHYYANGPLLLVETLPHTHSLSVGCFVGIGAGHEGVAQAGITHLIEHLVFKGSRRFPGPKEISAAIEGVGGIIDAYTDTESTVYYVKVADIHSERAIMLLGDILTHPRFRAQDLAKERRVILEELRETADTPSERVHLVFDQALWGDQPLGRDIAGDASSLASITNEQVRQYWAQGYCRANLTISLAGNIQFERAIELVEQSFAGLPTGQVLPPPVSLPTLRGPSCTTLVDQTEQSNFCLGFAALAATDPDRRVLLALDSIIGSSMSSRLVQEIREERGLAYSIGSYSREHADTGAWVVYGSVDPERLSECLAAVMQVLRQVVYDGIQPEELAQVKEQVKGGMLLALEDTWSVAARNGEHQRRYGRVIPIEQVVAEVEAITMDDMLRVARRVLRAEAMHLAVIGPACDSDALRALMVL